MTIATVKVHAADGVVRIALAGEIDLANAATVEAEIFAAVGNTAATVVLDLTDLLYLDSSGLRILFLLAGRLQMLQIGMEVVAPPGSPIRRAIEVFGLEPFVVLHP